MSATDLLTGALAELAKVEVKPNRPASTAGLAAGKQKVREARALLEAAPASLPEPAPTPSTSAIDWGAWIDGSAEGSGRGTVPWDKVTWELFCQHAGKKPTLLHWGQPVPVSGTMDLNALNLCHSYGAKPVVDTQFPIAEIISGAKNSAIDALANVLKTFGHPVILRFGWEQNGGWFPWGRNPDFIAAWRIYVTRVRAICGSQVQFLWCPNLQYDAASREWIDKTWPGDDFVDYAGFDGYNFGGDEWRSATTAYKATYDHIAALTSKPMIVGETASAEAGDGGTKKAEWITALLGTTLPSLPQIKAFLWFDWPIIESGVTRTWPIESSAPAQAAFKAGIASSYYKAGGSS
jgi:hypothetical protein